MINAVTMNRPYAVPYRPAQQAVNKKLSFGSDYTRSSDTNLYLAMSLCFLSVLLFDEQDKNDNSKHVSIKDVQARHDTFDPKGETIKNRRVKDVTGDGKPDYSYTVEGCKTVFDEEKQEATMTMPNGVKATFPIQTLFKKQENK